MTARFRGGRLFYVLSVAGLVAKLSAATTTWDGGSGTGAWSTSGNWNPNAFPASTTSLVFNAAAANGQYNIALGWNRTTAGISFSSAAGSNAFTFSGSTLTVNAGGLVNNDAQSQTFSSAVTVNTAQTWATTTATGGFTFGTVTLLANLSLTGAAPFSITSLTNSSGNHTFDNESTGTVTIGAIDLSENKTRRTLTFDGVGNTLVSRVIANGGKDKDKDKDAGNIVKTGDGTLTLAGSNTYSGTTTVNAGTLVAQGSSSLGSTSSAVTVNSGGTLTIADGTTMTYSGTLSLNGTGATATTGALHGGTASGQSSAWDGSLALTGNTTISSGSGLLSIGNGYYFNDTLNLGANTITFNTTATPTVTPVLVPTPSYILDPANIVVNAAITGTGGLNKTGPGTLLLIPAINPSTFTGNTTVTGGKLIVDNQENSSALSSTNIFVGNSGTTGTADSVILQMGQQNGTLPANNLIGIYNSSTNASSSNLTVYADGLYNMNSANNGFVNLTLQGGHVSGGNPALNPLLTLTGGVVTTASSRTAIIENGNLAMSANAFTFNIATGTTSTGVDLRIDDILQNGAGFTAGNASTSLSKTGTGTLVLTGTNVYGGVTTVAAGALNIQNSAGLGQNGSTLGNLTNGTVVSSGAQLQFQGGISVGSETLTLNGTGITNTGALLNVSGHNSSNGFINLAGATNRINSASGTLTLTNPTGVSGSIINGTSAGRALTFGGAGNTIVNGGISGFVSNLTKDGTGTLTLAGSNGYVGTTSITQGAVKVTNNNGLAGTGVTVSSGAALQFGRTAASANITVTGVASTISGTGVSNGGALQNLDGTNTYLGAVTLAANSRITANSGSALTLSGNVNGAGFTLDAGGAGNTTYSGVISGTGSVFAKNDSGTVTLSGSAANTFTGGVSVNNGTLLLNKTTGNATGTGNITVGDGVGSANSATLRLSQSNQISDTARITVGSDGRFDLNGLNETIGSFAGTGTIATGAGTLTTGSDNLSSTFGGTLSGTGVIRKIGSGDLTFNASMNYGGEFNLSGGELTLAGVNLTVGTLRISGNTILDFGNSAASVLNATNVVIENNATLTINNWVTMQDFFYATGSFVHYNTTTTVTTPALQHAQGVSPENQITFNGYSNNATAWQSWDKQIIPAPEPATYGAVFMSGALGLIGYRRWRRVTPAPTT